MMGMSTQDYELLRRNLGLLPDEQQPKSSVNKYKAVKKQLDGITFDSTKEAEAYIRLKALEVAGKITELECQPRFVLQESFRGAGGMLIRAITFRADFGYIENGQRIVVDVKSKATKTEAFSIRWKLLKKLHPEIKAEIWD